MRVSFLTTHLSGSGHLMRIAELARAAKRAGHVSQILNGGWPLAHAGLDDLDISQLPPLHVRDLDYSVLLDAAGLPAGAGYLRSRIAQVERSLAAFGPDILVTETYPLGRRALMAEFEAALAATGALAVASVRDIPEPKSRRLAEVADRLKDRFVALLVHGSADFIPLSASWPLEGIDPLIHHTGYICAAGEQLPIAGGVLVSVGGGTLGRRFLPVAARAARLSPHPWRILIGGPDAAQVKLPPAPNLSVEPARRDYRGLLAGAACSVSLCGYNTAMDLAACTTPAILVPMIEHGEREQAIRTERMVTFPGIETISMDDVTPRRLATLVDKMVGTRRPKLPLDTDGAARSIETLETLVARK